MTKGQEGFEYFYELMWGERWSTLKTALQAPDKKVTLPNGYSLDPASLDVALALNSQPGDRVLDMCSAPGGKALASILSVEGQGEWVLNDMSKDRVHRLKRVIQEFIPQEWHKNIHITCRDASRWGLHEQNQYDKVLVDAPCSGERHLLENTQELERWTKKRSEGLAHRQYALLCAALDAVKPGGRIVYSTCSISSLENDQVLAKLKRKKGERFQVAVDSDVGSNNVFTNILAETNTTREPTEFGTAILPDISLGQGPIYYAVIEKL